MAPLVQHDHSNPRTRTVLPPCNLLGNIGELLFAIHSLSLNFHPFLESLNFPSNHSFLPPPAEIIYEACSPSEPGAKEMTLQFFADNNLADKVEPPRITMRDFEKVQWACMVGGRRFWLAW